MIKILFICHGNICRSPRAQFVFQDMVCKARLEKKFYIDSSATSTEEIGNPVHRGTRAKMNEMGIPMVDHRAVQMKKEDYRNYNYLIGMDQWNIRNMMRIVGKDPDHKIFKMLEFAGSDRDVADPWYTGDFDATYRDIVAGCTGLLEKIREEKGF